MYCTVHVTVLRVARVVVGRGDGWSGRKWGGSLAERRVRGVHGVNHHYVRWMG